MYNAIGVFKDQAAVDAFHRTGQVQGPGIIFRM
jgi:hypothetical protein